MNQLRQSSISRDTKETKIKLDLTLDGSGKSSVNTGVGFFDHMLDLFAVHGRFDMSLQVNGDLEVDAHHTVEDVGICLGTLVRELIGDSKGIKRYASALVPMDEALAQVAIDVSNRPYLSLSADALQNGKIGQFDAELVEEFLRAFVNNARITCHIQVLSGSNLHHVAEAVFKGLARVLSDALSLDPNQNGIPSSKGVL